MNIIITNLLLPNIIKYLEINLTNIIANYQTLKSIAGNAICAVVVKDDAYGLGAIEVAKTLYEKENCQHFFVAHASEAQKIAPYIPKATIYEIKYIFTRLCKWK